MTPFPRNLAWYTVAVFTAAVACALLALSRAGTDAVAIALLGSLVVFSTHRHVTLPNGAFVSPGLMVCVAGIVVSAHEGSYLGPLLLGLLSGLNVQSMRRTAWGWIPFNAGVSALALGAAQVAFMALPDSVSEELPAAFVAVAALAAVYVGIAWALVALSYVFETRKVSREAFGGLGPLIVHVAPFSLLGFLLGRLYLALGPSVLVLIIVPILIRARCSRRTCASRSRTRKPCTC